MQTAEEITTAIDMLPRHEYIKILHWFSERDWQIWDEEIADDYKAGKLDFLIQEALEEKKRGILKSL